MRKIIGLGLAAGMMTGMILAAGKLTQSIRQRQWDGWGRFTIIKIGQEIKVESIDRKSKTGIRLTIPADVEINTLKQRGQWKPKSLAVLGSKYGWQWAGDSVADYLGIAYTGLWDKLSVWDKLSWWNLSRQTTWQDVNMAEGNLLASTIAVDNQKVLGISDRWGEKAREWFYAGDLAEAEAEIRVWNTTSEPGLAGKAAAVLESAGLRVIQTGESDRETEYCEIRTGLGDRGRRVVSWIRRVLKCKEEKDSQTGNFIDIYLGSGYAQRYVSE